MPRGRRVSDLRGRLRDSGYRLTPERELILAAVEKLSTRHARRGARGGAPAVLGRQRLHGLPHAQGPRGSRPVRHAHLSDRAPTYHSVTDHEHFHLVCRNCGRIASVGPRHAAAADRPSARRHDFTVDVEHLTVFGACVECPPQGRHEEDEIDQPAAGPARRGRRRRGGRRRGGPLRLVQHRAACARGRRRVVDLSHREVVRISGPDRATWLHSLTTQHFLDLPVGRWTEALILSPQGHVEHAFAGVDDGDAFTAHTEPAGPRAWWSSSTGCGS